MLIHLREERDTKSFLFFGAGMLLNRLQSKVKSLITQCLSSGKRDGRCRCRGYGRGDDGPIPHHNISPAALPSLPSLRAIFSTLQKSSNIAINDFPPFSPLIFPAFSSSRRPNAQRQTRATAGHAPLPPATAPHETMNNSDPKHPYYNSYLPSFSPPRSSSWRDDDH